MPVVSLIGYRGSGKSTVAAELAHGLGCGWIDADAALEESLGTTIADLVRDRGEGVFRDAEAAMLEALLARADGVLATGGGVVLREGNRRLLRQRGGLVVWLTAPAAELRRRLAADPATRTRRPALGGGDVLAEIDAALEAREPLYRSCADLEVDVGSARPDEIAARILARLAAGGAQGAGGPA